MNVLDEVNKHWESRMDNPETLATLGTQDTRKTQQVSMKVIPETQRAH